jgi:hypothetical protein
MEKPDKAQRGLARQGSEGSRQTCIVTILITMGLLIEDPPKQATLSSLIPYSHALFFILVRKSTKGFGCSAACNVNILPE